VFAAFFEVAGVLQAGELELFLAAFLGVGVAFDL
jgi:hypothetical protein